MPGFLLAVVIMERAIFIDTNAFGMNLNWKIKLASGFKLDLAANFAGVGWSFLTQIVCVPLYLRFLGIEAYGLIGFYLMLQAILQVLDFGLSPTMNREMARYSVQPEKTGEARDLVRTLEIGYWLIAIAIGTAILAAAPVIAAHWIKAGSIPVRDVQYTVMLMGVLAVFQWPASFYQGGLMGLGRQVLCNGLTISFSAIANGGAVLILWRVSPTIQAFFQWLVVVNTLKAIFLAIFLWKSLPRATRPPRFDLHQVQKIWRFAAGMSGITACALALTQSDKIILSKLFSLKTFGYYTLAGMFGAGLSMIVGAVFNTLFARFSALVAAGNQEALKRLYHRSTQLMAVLILPLAAVLALFSTGILQLWTRNAEVAHNAGPIASVLVVGTAINGLMHLPYALQLAHGWTSIGLRINILLTITLVPAVWILATHYGAVGAASVWVALNCIYMVIGVPLTHRRLLRGETSRWFVEDVGLSLTAGLLVASLGRVLIARPMSAGWAIISFSVVFLGALVAAAFAAPQIRRRLLSELSKLRLGYS
jgi:O-antigen/teichoic acid export membrane protein